MCAHLAYTYDAYHILDKTIQLLASVSGLVDVDGKFQHEDEETYGDGHYVHVPTSHEHPVTAPSGVNVFAIRFGRYYKGQFAAVLMFNLTRDYGNMIQAGWKSVRRFVFIS
jgi:hypothetical protein